MVLILKSIEYLILKCKHPRRQADRQADRQGRREGGEEWQLKTLTVNCFRNADNKDTH